MDIKLNEVLDVSSFLLVEESADSEAAFLTWEMCLDAPAAAGGEDDAESCSCDATSDQVFDYDDVDDQDFSDSDDEDDDRVVDNDDDDHNHGELRPSTARCCKLWLGYMSTEEGEEEESSRVGFKKKLKDGDQMEDKVFWETCMAVGYP